MADFFFSLNRGFSLVLLLILLFFPVLPFNFSSIIIIVFCLTSVFLNWKRGIVNFKANKFLIINCLFALLIAISLVYSSNIEQGIIRIKTLLPIIILPIIIVFFQKKYDDKNYFLIFKVFIFSNFLFLIFLIFYFLFYSVEHCYYEISELPLIDRIPYIWKVPFENLLWCAEQKNESFFLIHKTYNSINLLISSLFIIQLFFKRKSSIFFKVILVILLLIFSIVIIYLKSIIGVFFILTIIPFNIILLKYNFKKALIYLSLLVFSLIAVLVAKKDAILSSFNKETISNNGTINKNEIDGLFERFFLNKTSAQLIYKKPLIGYGIGDVKDNLKKQNLINSRKNKIYLNIYKNELNTHNYYFNLLIAGGPIVLLSFIYMLFYNARLAIKSKNNIYLSFIIIMAISLCFENLLDRMTGVLTYAILNSLFIKYIIDNKQNKYD